MNRKWVMLWSVLLLVALAGQSAAIQVSQTATPAVPKKDAKLMFNLSFTNNETGNITEVGVNTGYSWSNTSFDSMLADQPGRDELTTGVVAPGAKVTFHIEINLKNQGLSAGKSHTYNYTVTFFRMNGTQKLDRSFYTTPEYPLKIASNPAPPAKTPGFEGLLAVPVVALAAMLAWRKHR